MNRLGAPHLVFSVVAALVFGAMAVSSADFSQTAQWFPLYVGIFGAMVALAAIVVCVLSILRTRREATEAEEVREAGVLAGSAEAGNAGGDVVITRVVEIAQIGPDVHVGDDGQLHVDEPEDEKVMARGFMWLAVWLGFVVLSLLIGYIAASALWIGVWFRTMYKWRWVVVIPVVVFIVALLLFGEAYVNIRMPGPNWLQGLFR